MKELTIQDVLKITIYHIIVNVKVIEYYIILLLLQTSIILKWLHWNNKKYLKLQQIKKVQSHTQDKCKN